MKKWTYVGVGTTHKLFRGKVFVHIWKHVKKKKYRFKEL